MHLLKNITKWLLTNIYVAAILLALVVLYFVQGQDNEIAAIAASGALVVRLIQFAIIAVAVMVAVRAAQSFRVLFPKEGYDASSTAVSRALTGGLMYIAFSVIALAVFG